MTLAETFRNCPVCGSGDAAPHWRKGGLQLVRCRHCDMVYVNPVASEFASGQFYDATGEDYYLSPAKLESDYADVRFERELRLFRAHCQAGKVLDVGCSSGAFLYQLNKRFPGCYETLGTDVSGAPLDHAEQRGVPVARGNFLELNLQAVSFDAVTFWAVLEHLLEPGRFLDQAASLLKHGGHCFVLVPNLRSLAARLLGPRYRYVYAQHTNYFTKRTLSRLVGERFALLKLTSKHFNPIVIWQDWRGGGREVSNQERAALLKRTTRYKQSPLLKCVKPFYAGAEKFLGVYGLADNLVAVLQKP